MHPQPAPKWRNAKRYPSGSLSGLYSNDAGIFVTCDKGQEAKCNRDMEDILSEVASSQQKDQGEGVLTEDHDEVGGDIEGDIGRELESMKRPSASQKKAYSFVRLDISCVSFIRLEAPLDPVSVVRQICSEANSSASRQRSRYVKRMTPVSCVQRLLGNGLEQLCGVVLGPVFGQGSGAKKFAIRPTIRNNDQVDRDSLIKTVADVVTRMGASHSVDLKHYDCLILVDVYKNVCGMSVVGQEFETFKRFNLAEIYHPTKREGVSRKLDLL